MQWKLIKIGNHSKIWHYAHTLFTGTKKECKIRRKQSNFPYSLDIVPTHWHYDKMKGWINHGN